MPDESGEPGRNVADSSSQQAPAREGAKPAYGDFVASR
jgi:hypothetical protein